jgi:apolipoprotein N-acyltransferase
MTQRVWRKYPLPLWVVFPLALSGIEFFRNSVLYGGFPWGNLGNSLASVPVCLQAASLFGVYGMVFWIAMVNAVLAEIIWWKKGLQAFPKWGAVAAVTLSSALMVFGALKLQQKANPQTTLKVALLQGNIEQGIKNKQRQHKPLILDKYRKLQEAAHAQEVDLIVWPEASLPGGVGVQYTNLKLFGVPPFKASPAKKPNTLIGAVLVVLTKPIWFLLASTFLGLFTNWFVKLFPMWAVFSPVRCKSLFRFRQQQAS